MASPVLSFRFKIRVSSARKNPLIGIRHASLFGPRSTPGLWTRIEPIAWKWNKLFAFLFFIA
jgi:hypothetical protein